MLDRQTFEDIFREHHAACLAFAVHYTGNVHEAEEVVQQVFLRLWEKRAVIDITGATRSYLLAAIRNTAISNWRKETVRQEKEQTAGHLQAADVPVQSPVWELEKRYQQALEVLPERCREVFILSRQQQLKYHEIAEVMNISVKTVENQMGKALKIMHRELKDYLNLLLLLF
ncbi:RNA polymerase sigma-70 factor, ECF subfamily [Chitinophaga sp. YR627]|uniref:RNA polymerase sigma-70 factor n=1 Tax=Chitinophaga sp. YR627 TaxID=1881041 RepID=UPI0008E959D8|nr:RNA polymerase sigma-70 factor [Chitinophaga sp. YR627]SFO23685.1 RNA polymerase sigma-70 factor, ECF subfamily [Chitinophaga sp. YR627]